MIDGTIGHTRGNAPHTAEDTERVLATPDTLFSVFSGSAETIPNLPAYLRAAAATQSRAFPTFSYDPAAGESWASRL